MSDAAEAETEAASPWLDLDRNLDLDLDLLMEEGMETDKGKNVEGHTINDNNSQSDRVTLMNRSELIVATCC